jgi:hypothetical protein
MQLVPESEPTAHGFDYLQPGVNGVIGIGDKLQLEPRCFFRDARQSFQTIPREDNSPRFSSSKQLVELVDWRIAQPANFL